MKATKDYISLETAKLLKDCGIDSKYYYTMWHWGNLYINQKISFSRSEWNMYPSFTWQEILWENEKKFFWEIDTHLIWSCQRTIFLFLTEKKYDEADKYFRENCILIKNDMKAYMETLERLEKKYL